MKITATATMVTALSALSTGASAAKCLYKTHMSGSEIASAAQAYTVTASGVEDIPGICGGLWDNLRVTLYPGMTHSCGGDNGNLTWKFALWYAFSNEGDVHSAFWRATKNEYGSIACDIR